jgi:hypothetical protein
VVVVVVEVVVVPSGLSAVVFTVAMVVVTTSPGCAIVVEEIVWAGEEEEVWPDEGLEEEAEVDILMYLDCPLLVHLQQYITIPTWFGLDLLAIANLLRV